MNSPILTKICSEPPLDKREILRYAGVKEADSAVCALLEGCLEEAQGRINYRVCYRELGVTVRDGVCDFGAFSVESQSLAENLKNCGRVILLAATLGVEIDRLISKYGSVSPAKAHLFGALGTERIEALCNGFCDSLKAELKVSLTPRFSPGYGDLTLETQREIFALLDCSRQIGLYLNGSLLMSPTKSVTAFVGIYP